MQRQAVAFGVGKEGHVAVVGGDVLFGLQYLAAGGFYLVEYRRQVGVGVEVDQYAPGGGLVPLAGAKGAAYLRGREKGHLQGAEVRDGQFDAKNGFVKSFGPV